MAKLDVIVGNEVVNLAAEYLFAHGKGDHGTEKEPIVFADLSDADKLALVEEHQKEVIVNLANSWKSTEAQRAARETEAETKHSI